MPRGLNRSDAPLVIAAPLLLEAWAVARGLGPRQGSGVEVVRTGMGPARARRAAAGLRTKRVRCLAVAGLAGSVDPAVGPGDVVVASELRGPDGRTLALDGADIVAALESLGLRVHRGAIACVDHLVRGAERESLRARGVLAVDMESFWLAEAGAGRPVACVRVIVDAPGRELLSPATLSRGARALAVLSRVAGTLPTWAADRPRGVEQARSRRFARPASVAVEAV